ncbi:MAG: ABC transporter permease [Eubacterium sp.]
MKQMKQTTLRRLISLCMLLVLILLFSILGGHLFFNADNFIEIVRDASVVGIVGVGVTMAIITAGIDLSTGAIMALVAMTMANIYAYTLWPIPVMLLVGLLVGAIAGFINGYVIGYLHVPEFIGTLATMSIYRSLTYIIAIKDANGVIQSQPMTVSDFVSLGYAVGYFYIVTIAMIIFIVIGQIVLKFTRFGTDIYAVGASKKAARLSGINVEKTQLFVYMICGICCAVGGIFTSARLQSATAALGDGFEFDPIAAAVVGGVALSGGSGDVVGTLIGALFMATLENGILKLNINTAYQYVIKGIIIILVVMFDSAYKSHMDKKAKEQGAKEAQKV